MRPVTIKDDRAVTLEEQIAKARRMLRQNPGCAPAIEYADSVLDVLRARLAAQTAALKQANDIIDWLEENTAYIMLGADYTRNRYTMQDLPNKGKGWRDGELRRAVMTRIIAEK